MLNVISEKILDYCDTHTTPDSSVLSALAEETRRTSKRSGMLIGRTAGTFLTLVARSTGARRVLEIGTFTGYSALKFAEGLPVQGEVITCDINPDTTALARRYWAKSPHGSKISLRLGPALETIKTLSGPFDIVFIDADKGNCINYWEACLPMVRSGGVVLVDNVLWSGRVLDPVEKDDAAIVAFNDHAARDPRVDVVMLTVRDGIMMACKR
jgi:caffeoyl-CoA O-methyltransferase